MKVCGAGVVCSVGVKPNRPHAEPATAAPRDDRPLTRVLTSLEPPPSGLYTASSLPRTYMGARRVPTSPHDDSSCSGSCARPRVKSNARIPRRSPARSSSLGFDCKLCIVQNADLPPRHPAVLSLAATTKSGDKPVNPGVAAPMGLCSSFT